MWWWLVLTRVAQHLVALTAGIWHTWTTSVTNKRPPTTTNTNFTESTI